MDKLGLRRSHPDQPLPLAAAIAAAPAGAPPVKAPTEAQLRMASNLSMQPNDAAEISDMFFARQRQRARADPAQSRTTRR